ncbi:MAG: porin [Spongiibacteraceae bacterium]
MKNAGIRILRNALAVSIAMIGSPLAGAADGVAELLLKKGVITAEEYTQLKQETPAPVAAPISVATASATAAGPSPAPAMPNISFSKGFIVSSIDGSYSAQIGTLMQMDVAAYSENKSNDSDGIDNNAGTEMRRGRIYLQGKVMKDWQYKFELELFGTTGTELTDGYVRYNGFKPFDSVNPLAVTVGHFKIPFSFEQLMADKDLSLMERSLPNGFLKSRAPGLMVSSNGEHWSAAAMAFGEQLYSNTTSPQQDEGGGASARITWAPIVSENSALHFGLSEEYVAPTQRVGAEITSFSTRPESHMTSLSLISTGNISGDVSKTQLLGAEFAATYRSLTLQSEYIRTTVERDVGTDPVFSGWYAQGAWMITGENRPYDVGGGIFKGISPAHPIGTGGSSFLGKGAWELVARYSTMDLSDDNISGGRERNATLGLGWYANNFVRISGNLVHVYDIDGGKYDGESMNALQMRFQLAY